MRIVGEVSGLGVVIWLILSCNGNNTVILACSGTDIVARGFEINYTVEKRWKLVNDSKLSCGVCLFYTLKLLLLLVLMQLVINIIKTYISNKTHGEYTNALIHKILWVGYITIFSHE